MGIDIREAIARLLYGWSPALHEGRCDAAMARGEPFGTLVYATWEEVGQDVHDQFLRRADAIFDQQVAVAKGGGTWVPQIGERVEATDDVPDAADWRALSLWVAGVRVHDSGDGLDVTVSDQWPIPSRVSAGCMGQADDFRIGASSVADMLRPLRSPAGER